MYKIVIHDQARVNGGSNYENPGQLWVLKLVQIKSDAKKINKTQIPDLLYGNKSSNFDLIKLKQFFFREKKNMTFK